MQVAYFIDQVLLDLWKNSFLQMHNLCEGNGTNYLHVLQPNQHLTGSKPLSDVEKKLPLPMVTSFRNKWN